MARRALPLLGMVLMLVGVFQAQVTLEWARRYNGTRNDVDAALAIAVDDSGSVYITGASTGLRGYFDITTLKYTRSGDQIWVNRFNEVQNASMRGYNLAIDLAHNVYIAGEVVLKLNAQGDTVWIKRISGTFSGMRFINLDSFGFPIATGVRINDYQTKKHSPAGVELWARYLNGPGNGNDETYAQNVDSRGNVIVTGRLDADTSFLTAYIIGTAKYTPTGDTAWIRYYDGPGAGGYDAGYGIATDDSGNVFITGESDDLNGTPEIIVIKYNTQGAVQWTTRYRGPSSGNAAYEIAVDSTGNVYVAGVTGCCSYILVKFNPQGTALWSRVFAQYPLADLPKLALDKSGSAYVCAAQVRGSWSDFRLVKYDAGGNQSWLRDYPTTGTGSYLPYGMVVDRQGNIYVTGTGANDYLTLKYSQQPVAVEPSTTQPSAAFALYQNYPNPFNPGTTIEFDLPKSTHVRIAVFDILGRVIVTLVNEQLPAGHHKAVFDGRERASGLYIYRLQTSEVILTKGMSLLK